MNLSDEVTRLSPTPYCWRILRKDNQDRLEWVTNIAGIIGVQSEITVTEKMYRGELRLQIHRSNPYESGGRGIWKRQEGGKQSY